MLNLKREQIRYLTIIVCLIILASGPGQYVLFPLGTVGYTSGYEGVKASYSGIEWQHDDESGTADQRGTSFYFDADDPQSGACNLVGEMTNAFLPESTVSPSWVPSDWEKALTYVNNPVETYSWDLPNPDNPDETIAYEMQEWILRMYVSITAEWDTEWAGENSEYNNQRYTDTEVWIELDISPIWYFEGTNQVYFAIGKVVCSDFAYGKLGSDNWECGELSGLAGDCPEEYTPTSWISVTPESPTSYVYIYYQNYGAAGQAKTDYASYKGRRLNPSLFTDKVYISVGLNNFGTEDLYYYPGNWIHKGDAVTWAFDVHVFVVGEWTVQDIEELPSDYGRIGKQTTYKDWWVQIIEDPRFPLFTFLGILALIFLLLAIFAPWVLFSIFGFIGLVRDKS